MIATVVLAAVAALDLSGVFPPEVKTVGVVMPASILAKAKYDRGVDALKAAGYRVKPAPRLSFDKLAPVEDRVKDFEETWLDPEVDLVLCARGGSGAEKVMRKLDWAKLRTRNDQRLLGFSNITWLLNTMLRENVGHPISGPSLTQFRYLKKPSLSWLAEVLAKKPLKVQPLKALKPGAFAGLPCGGHLDILRGMAERKLLPDATGRVVFLECSVRDPRLVAGYVKTLLDSGWFKGAAGVVFGDITPGDEKLKPLKGAARTAALATLEQMKRDFAAKVDCPVYENYDYGHVPVSLAIDFRRRVSVSPDGLLQYD